MLPNLILDELLGEMLNNLAVTFSQVSFMQNDYEQGVLLHLLDVYLNSVAKLGLYSWSWKNCQY